MKEFCFSSVHFYFKKFTTAGIRFPGKCAVIFPDCSVITHWAKGIFLLLFFYWLTFFFAKCEQKALKVHSLLSFPVWEQTCLVFIVTSLPFGTLQFCFWLQCHIPSQCKYSGDCLLALSWGRGSKTSSQTFTPPIPLHLYHLSKLQVDAFAGQYATYNSYPEFSI